MADPALTAVAVRHAATPFEIALAWLTDLSPVIVPLPGVTRVETARSAAKAQRLELTDEDRRVLDDRFPAGRSSTRSGAAGTPAPLARSTTTPRSARHGPPGAGKDDAGRSASSPTATFA
jgi:hypothetical protein